MSKVSELRGALERQKGKRDGTKALLDTTKNRLVNALKSLESHEQARKVVQEVALKTQEGLQYHISEIVTLAMSGVFDNPYELVTRFVQRRNKTECDLIFKRDDVEYSPMDDTGGGSLDVAAFALRVASYTMKVPRGNNVLILDEPFKHLKGQIENRRALNMVREISKKLNIQIIMVSDERVPREDIIDAADRVFEVAMNRKGISLVKKLGKSGE